MSYSFTWNRDGSTDVGGVVIDWDEDCLVTYTVFGKYVRAKLNAPMDECYPAEYPEIEIESIIDSRGVDIADQLFGKEEQQVEQAALDNYESGL